MKKIIMSIIVSLGLLFIIFGGNSTKGYAEAVDFNPNGVLEVEKVINFNELPESEKEYFKSEGFDETNEYFSKTIIQNSTNPRLRVANAVTIHGSSQKVSNTMGYTVYTITSINSPMYSINTILTYGSQTYNSYVNVNWEYGYSGGIYFSWTGSSGYRTIKVKSQVYNTLGSVSVSCNAGGLTLGK